MAEHPDQINLSPYAYVGNNPILHDDPDGNCPLCWIALDAAVDYFAGASIEELAVGGMLATVAAASTVNHARNATTGSVSTFGNTTIYNANSSGELSKAAPKGSNNPTTKEAAKTGQEAHRQEQKKLKEQGAEVEKPMTLPKTGDKVRKDAVMPDGTAVIIKPNTPTGNKSGDKRL